MSTVALSMIVKDEASEVSQLLHFAYPHLDQLNIVVSDKRTYDDLRKTFFNFPKIQFRYRKWNNRFDEARNVALSMCQTKYMFWLDADDSFDFASIPELVSLADAGHIDAIFLPYNYMQDERGEIITLHYRERLVRLDKGYSWRGWVHETLISDEKVVTHQMDSPVVKHNSTIEDSYKSHARNHEILVEAYEATQDPRYLHYLGMSYFSQKDYEKAASLLSDYLQVGGSIEDSYRSLALISECAYHLGKFDMALEYATKCATLKPEYPMAYWLLEQYEADQDNFEEALEWFKVSESKPDPDTLSVWDPTSRERAILTAARCLFMLQRYNEALTQLRRIPKSVEAAKIYNDVLEEADAETFVNLLPRIRKFFRDDKSLWNVLCHDIQFDTRIQSFRYIVNEPKTWSEKSLVIFCGQGYEEWGPQTLDKGMGGSEEAVIYLSREFAKLGYHVTVFGEVTERLVDIEMDGRNGGIEGSVTYLPWKEIDVRDKFNVFVSWRAPQYIEKINAKVKLVDVHDVLPPVLMKDYSGVTYMVKTNYHRSLTPDLPDEKFAVIGNGIKKEQFK